MVGDFHCSGVPVVIASRYWSSTAGLLASGTAVAASPASSPPATTFGPRVGPRPPDRPAARAIQNR